MKKWTKQLLEESGYEIENAQIESVRLTMADIPEWMKWAFVFLGM